jgi:hypothetical protein
MSYLASNTKVNIRHLTAAEWASSQIRLAVGEPGFDTTNNILKIGTGTQLFTALPSIGGNSSVIDNVGRRRYVSAVDVTGQSYFPASGSSPGYIFFSLRIYGNANRYRFNFSYTPTLLTYSLGSLTGTPNTFTVNNGTTPLTTTNIAMYINNPTSTTTYSGILTTTAVDDFGQDGTSCTTNFSTPSITSGDTMGAPIASAAVGTITINMPSPPGPAIFSGVSYYRTGTTITFPAGYFRLSNLYNTSGNTSFNYFDLTNNHGITVSYPTSGLKTLIGSNAFPNGTSGTVYTNANSITYTMTAGSNYSDLYFSATYRNALTATTGPTRIFPVSTTIAYIQQFSETDLPRNQYGRTTSALILTQTRMSLTGPDTVTTFNSSALSSYDIAYYPFSNLLMSTGFNAIFNNITVVSRQTYTEGTEDNPKYLTIRLTFGSSFLTQFNMYIDESTANISSVFVRWTTISGGQSTIVGNRWFDATKNYTTDINGCQTGSYNAGIGTGFYPITLNSSISTPSGFSYGYADIKIAVTYQQIPFNNIVFT